MGGNCFSFQREMTAPAIIQSTGRQTASVIFMHGLGDTGHGWCQAFHSIKLAHVKYVFPHAPIMPVTLNGGMQMNSWFDIAGLTEDSPEDVDGIHAATKTVHGLIEEEISSGIPSNRILVGGFSQGGALALYSALTYPKMLAGVVALSCWLPLYRKMNVEKMSLNRSVPILQCHGEKDVIVPPKLGHLTASLLATFCPKHEASWFKNLGHSSNEEEMEKIGRFVSANLPAISG